MSTGIHLVGLAFKQLVRNRTRTALTVCGVASGMFLFTSVETMQRSLDRATRIKATDTTLVVYRQNRFCPATSRLPEYYLDEIKTLPGVREAIPVKITVNNCGASLDVITFRGVPPMELTRYAPEIEWIEGTLETWQKRDDGAVLGKDFASKRGLKVGDSFAAAGVRVVVSGIIDSPHPQDSQVAYVHLPFLQQASKAGLGEVTQFNVRVESVDQLAEVATAIDQRFKSEAAPTWTRPEKAFFAQTARELIDLIGFTRWIGYGAVLAVIGLIGNAVLLMVRGRVKENAILQTLGFSPSAVARLVLAEGGLLGLAGGILGTTIAAVFLHWRKLTFGSEGQVLAMAPDAGVLAMGLVLALALGLLAALWPAVLSWRTSIVTNLRS